MTKQKKVSFQTVINSLLDTTTPFPPIYLPEFSDLSPENAMKLSQTWKKIPSERRISLLEDLEEAITNDTLMSFEDVAKVALHDAEARARELAILLLWENFEEKLIPILIQAATKDADTRVRAQATSKLGFYVLQGELDEISERYYRMVNDALFVILNGTDDDTVRCAALEGLGFSSRDDMGEIIRTAFQKKDLRWKASAVMAMGRSAHTDLWGQSVLGMLKSEAYDVQMEAVRAAGNLELEAAREPLLEMLNNGVDDDELRDMMIWSLSHIGGEGVMEMFNKLTEEAVDDEELEFLEDAIDTLMMSSGDGLNATGFYGIELENVKDFDDLDEPEKDDED